MGQYDANMSMYAKYYPDCDNGNLFRKRDSSHRLAVGALMAVVDFVTYVCTMPGIYGESMPEKNYSQGTSVSGLRNVRETCGHVLFAPHT